jgi:hypothetical protein
MVYQNLTKTRTFKVEAKGKGFSIMEYRNGKQRVMATYPSRAEAERELSLFAYDGFRRVE